MQSLIPPSTNAMEFSSAQVEFNLSYHTWYAHVGLLTAVEGELSWANIFQVIKNILLSKTASTLNSGCSFKDIARYLCKDPTTISKEIKLHRLSDWYHKGSFNNAHNFCIHRYHCQKVNACGKIILCGVKCTTCPTCNQTCPDFRKEGCNQSTLCMQRMSKSNQSLHNCSQISLWRYFRRS